MLTETLVFVDDPCNACLSPFHWDYLKAGNEQSMKSSWRTIRTQSPSQLPLTCAGGRRQHIAFGTEIGVSQAAQDTAFAS